MSSRIRRLTAVLSSRPAADPPALITQAPREPDPYVWSMPTTAPGRGPKELGTADDVVRLYVLREFPDL